MAKTWETSWNVERASPQHYHRSNVSTGQCVKGKSGDGVMANASIQNLLHFLSRQEGHLGTWVLGTT